MTKFNKIKISTDILDIDSWLDDDDIANIFFESDISPLVEVATFLNEKVETNKQDSDEFEVVVNSTIRESSFHYLLSEESNSQIVFDTEINDQERELDTNYFDNNSVHKAA